MPRSSIAWLSGLIFSRGMSQVSEMMLATVSNVEDIGKSLNDKGFTATPEGGTAPGPMLACPGIPPCMSRVPV